MTDVLRKELSFEELIVTDWEGIKRVDDRNNIAATPREALAMCINEGIDMSMVPNEFSFYDLLIEAVKLKEVPMSRIDDAVKKILVLKYNLGYLTIHILKKKRLQILANPNTKPLLWM